MQIMVKSFEDFRYREVFLITELKDGCVYKTKSIGYIHVKDSANYPPDKYVLASLSTSLTKQGNFTLELL